VSLGAPFRRLTSVIARRRKPAMHVSNMRIYCSRPHRTRPMWVTGEVRRVAGACSWAIMRTPYSTAEISRRSMSRCNLRRKISSSRVGVSQGVADECRKDGKLADGDMPVPCGPA
jgi:hypothetical protein